MGTSLGKGKGRTEIDGLIEWMTAEMKSRMRATAAVRNVGKLGVHHGSMPHVYVYGTE